MLRHELYSMIHVLRLKDENAADLLFGFRIGTVRGCDFAILPGQGQGGFRRLKRFLQRYNARWREDGRRIQSMRRTSPVARPRSCHQICPYRSIPNRRISSVRPCFRQWCSSIVILNKRFCAVKDLGEPRVVSRSLRHNNRAFGSLPYQTAPPPCFP
jgi:hypothetical protein